MGTDICIRRQTAEGTLFDKEDRYFSRNYELFGLLAQVRRENPSGLEPKGLPEGVDFPTPGHSHSYLTLDELRNLRDRVETMTQRVEGMKDRQELEEFRKGGELYPYCSGTNMPDYVRFVEHVPMKVLLQGDLDDLIEFVAEAGEGARMIFWFDC